MPSSQSLSQDANAQKSPNRLVHEKSPYLQQHAYNPVQWQSWGEEAFAEAKRRDCLVLVSIGYATCHWCHVMERESFEDPTLAAYLNQHFVTIKVDREERPDVDHIYMEALQAMEQQGGWPLNIFTTPQGQPIAGGTYFPPTAAHGRKSFGEVLELLTDVWQNRRQDALSNATSLTKYLQQRALLSAAEDQRWTYEPIAAACKLQAELFDSHHGGFRLQPQNKFPPSMNLRLLLRHHATTGDANALYMVENTLQAMLQGGIYDQLGGGLHRYSTDYAWHVPHFEKMLYDNALLVTALVETHQATGKAIYRAYAEDVLDYLSRDLTTPQGAFCSAQDADSEGVEGLFYVWTESQLQAHLSPEVARSAAAYWGVKAQGDFEGANILRVTKPLQAVAESLKIGAETLADHLQQARKVLLMQRSQRPSPLLDDKVITSWNALAISAFAQAGWAFNDATYTKAAQRAATFVWKNLRDSQGVLLRRWRQGEARFMGYLVDHSQLALAMLNVYQADFDLQWLQHANTLMQTVNAQFSSPQGPYYENSTQAETLLVRNCDGYDGVEPSGNSSAAMAFLMLHAYGMQGVDNQKDALRIFSSYTEHLQQTGLSFGAMLSALHFYLAPTQQIVVVGDPADTEVQAMLDVLRPRFAPHCVVSVATPSMVQSHAQYIGLLQGKGLVKGKAAAYVCQNMTCQQPVTNAQNLAAQLIPTKQHMPSLSRG